MSDTTKRLFLLDGMALVYRAHFALIRNPIMNSKGMNTSAIFGFMNTMLEIIDNHAPTHLGVAFDTKEPTPRHKIFPAYKAQRDAMPEDLAAAIPEIKRLLKAFNIPVVEIPGFEADDIIGTMAKQADDEGSFHTFMVTPDKDFAQLVSPTPQCGSQVVRGLMWRCLMWQLFLRIGKLNASHKSSISSDSGVMLLIISREFLG